MIAWKLIAGGKLLIVYKINPATRQVADEMKLALREPMTDAEAQNYVDAHFPLKEVTCAP